jgi:hypothetical protein
VRESELLVSRTRNERRQNFDAGENQGQQWQEQKYTGGKNESLSEITSARGKKIRAVETQMMNWIWALELRYKKIDRRRSPDRHRGTQRMHSDLAKSRGKNEQHTQNAKIDFPLKSSKIHTTTEVTTLPHFFGYWNTRSDIGSLSLI